MLFEKDKLAFCILWNRMECNRVRNLIYFTLAYANTEGGEMDHIMPYFAYLVFLKIVLNQ